MGQRRFEIFHRLPFVTRTAVKAFVRSPALSIPLLLAISLGIGANASVLDFINGLAHSIFPADASIVSIFSHDKTHSTGPMTRSDYELLRRQTDLFAWADAARVLEKTVQFGKEAELERVAEIPPQLRNALGFSTGQGAFVSAKVWQRYFGGGSYSAGHAIRIDGADAPVVGIARIGGLYLGQPVDVWRCVDGVLPDEDGRDLRDLWIVARLKNGVLLDEAERRDPLKDRVYMAAYSGALPEMAAAVSRIGTILGLAAAGVFLTACLVVASLLLGYALNRLDTMTIQRFLGASRLDFAMDRLVDCVVIFAAGGLLGLLLAACASHVIPNMLFADDAERLSFQASPMRIAAVALISTLVVAFCGCVPVFAATADSTWNPLLNARTRSPKLAPRLRALLAVGLIASCCTITNVTFCIIDSLHASFQRELAKASDELTLITVQAPLDPDNKLDYFDHVEKAIRSERKEASVAWTAQLPGAMPTWRLFRLQRNAAQGNMAQAKDVEMTATGLSKAPAKNVESAPLEGRLFGTEDAGCDDVVVDEDGAAKLSGKNSVGTTLGSDVGRPVEIIGVIGRDPNAMSGGSKLPPVYYDDSRANTPIPNGAHRYSVLQRVSKDQIALNMNFVSSEYFDLQGASLVAGSWLPAQEQAKACEKVGAINQEAADLYFKKDPIGSFVVDDRGVRTRIVGVVRSVPAGVLDPPTEPTLFLPMWQEHSRRMTLLVKGARGDGNDSALRRALEAVRGGTPGAAPQIRTTSSRLTESSLSPLRIATLLLGISAGIAYFLTAIALISAQANTGHQRRLESALRIALGASAWHVFRNTLAETGRVALCGVVAGTIGSIVVLHVLGHNLSIPTALPLRVWIVTPVATVAVLMAVSAAAAWKALRLQPYALLSDPNMRV